MNEPPVRDDAEALARAADPRTPTRELDELATQGGREVRAAVAGNPNASVERLAELSGEFPREVLDNGALAVLAVAEPERFREVSSDLLLRVCASPGAPAEVLAAALRRVFLSQDMFNSRSLSNKLAHALIRNPALPPSMVEGLAFNCLPVREAGRLHPNMPADVAELLRDYTSLSRHHLSRAPNAQGRPTPEMPAASPQTLERCMTLGPIGSELVAMSPSATPDQIARLVERAVMSPGFFIGPLAARGDLTREQVEWLINHLEPSELATLASHLRGFGDLLERLAASPEAEVRQGVATNTATPWRALERLATDPQLGVRQAVAGNPAAPTHAVALLATDPDPIVRRYASTNASPLDDLIARLEDNE